MGTDTRTEGEVVDLWRHFRLVVLVSSPRATLALPALAAGANGIVVKDGNASNLREAVRAVGDGGTYIDPRLAGQVVGYALRAHGLATPETWTRPAFGEAAP